MLGHATPEMLFTVYARYIPKRARRDVSAFAGLMAASGAIEKGVAAIPK